MILKKKKSYFEEELAKNWNKPKKLLKVLRSLGLSSNKASKSTISLKKDDTIQFEALESTNIFKRFYSELDLQKKFQRHPTNLLAKQPKTTAPRLHATYPMTLNCQTYLKSLSKRLCLASIPVKPVE